MNQPAATLVWTASELHYAGQPDWSSETRLPARPLFTNQDPYKHLGLGRLLCGLGTPQVVARGVRRAQRRKARLGDVDGGRRLGAGDARREAAEAREEDASSPGAAATWTLTSFTLQAMIASWRQAAAMPWQARRLMAP